MVKGKKRAVAAPPHADSNKDKQKQHPGAEQDDFSLQVQSVPADALKPKPKQGNLRLSLPFAAGDNKKVAVKIVDDRGIESLKIIALGKPV